jgi:hypothetical protein
VSGRLCHTPFAPNSGCKDAIAELTEPGAGEGPDSSYRFAIDIVREAEAWGFDSTLVA